MSKSWDKSTLYYDTLPTLSGAVELLNKLYQIHVTPKQISIQGNMYVLDLPNQKLILKFHNPIVSHSQELLNSKLLKLLIENEIHPDMLQSQAGSYIETWGHYWVSLMNFVSEDVSKFDPLKAQETLTKSKDILNSLPAINFPGHIEMQLSKLGFNYTNQMELSTFAQKNLDEVFLSACIKSFQHAKNLRSVNVHRDIHRGNFLINKQIHYLVDWDTLASGPEGLDEALFWEKILKGCSDHFSEKQLRNFALLCFGHAFLRYAYIQVSHENGDSRWLADLPNQKSRMQTLLQWI